MARFSPRTFSPLPPLCLRHGAIALLVVLLGGCTREASTDAKQVRPVATTGSGTYAVRFVVTHLEDHARLAAATVMLDVGEKRTAHRQVSRPTENQPVFSDFTAALSATGIPGTFQLVTKVALREVNRNKKGKLRYSKRNEGALLPIRAGETQNASATGDPVQIEVHLERR